MKRTTIIYFILCILFLVESSFADDVNLKLKSKVELRNWKLSSKAYKQETFVQGATIELYNASSVISKTTSDKDGNFEINIPPNGNYTLLITRPGYNSKKFIVNSKTIPVKPGDANFIPVVDMTSFIATKSIKGVGDLGLNQPIIKAEYYTSKSEADKQEVLRFSLNVHVSMNDAEYRVIQKFCICNKLGDLAMENKNYELAKTYYMMAMSVIPGEEYPKERLLKAAEGLKIEDLKRREIFKKTKSNAKTSVSKKTVVAKPVKSAVFKNSTGSGKSTRKTRRTLGK